MKTYDKILGGLLGGAIGDAMGAATETRSHAQIIERFGGEVVDIIVPPDDVFAAGFPKGSVTDDFSLAYVTCKTILERKGVIDSKTAELSLINWSETKYAALAGPTTIATINRLRGIEVPSNGFKIAVDNGKGTNGSAMKIAPIGLISNGDLDKAIEDAITICLPTHGNSTSLAAACAVAAAVSEATKNISTVDSIIAAGLYGAVKGDEFGCKIGKQLANPSVYKRMLLALQIADKYDDIEKVMEELCDLIGCGISAAEAIPTAFGLFKACKGDPMKTIVAAVNIGNDTDTIATIAGALAGTCNGVNDDMKKYLGLINEANGFDLEKMTEGIMSLWK